MTKVTTYDDQNNILATFQFTYWHEAIDFAHDSDMIAGNIRESDIVKFTVEKI